MHKLAHYTYLTTLIYCTASMMTDQLFDPLLQGFVGHSALKSMLRERLHRICAQDYLRLLELEESMDMPDAKILRLHAGATGDSQAHA